MSVECSDWSFNCRIAEDQYYDYVCATFVPFIDFAYDLEGETSGKYCVPNNFCQTVRTTGYSDDNTVEYNNFLDCSREMCTSDTASLNAIKNCEGCVEIGGGQECRGHFLTSGSNWEFVISPEDDSV